MENCPGDNSINAHIYKTHPVINFFFNSVTKWVDLLSATADSIWQLLAIISNTLDLRPFYHSKMWNVFIEYYKLFETIFHSRQLDDEGITRRPIYRNLSRIAKSKTDAKTWVNVDCMVYKMFPSSVKQRSRGDKDTVLQAGKLEALQDYGLPKVSEDDGLL